MEAWQFHRLIETDEETGEETQVGGGIIGMKIGAVNGSLNTIDITPVPIEQMQEEHWDSQYVRLQLADRVVWLEPEEIQTLVNLLNLAHNAAERNYNWAFG